MKSLQFERTEKAFCIGVVVAVTFSTHVADKLRFFQLFKVDVRSLWAAPIRMYDDVACAVQNTA